MFLDQVAFNNGREREKERDVDLCGSNLMFINLTRKAFAATQPHLPVGVDIF